ncbi:hypothetical protein RRG08_034427 [Elysia crispata]|uniref:Uncharacterized protein n=1 Tax=Elysia crispata TaxID=231223 RepID=A0AAE0YDU8_9GAST|nr:hypothetical protein RRG08_034427 [Elysia crispata]
MLKYTITHIADSLRGDQMLKYTITHIADRLRGDRILNYTITHIADSLRGERTLKYTITQIADRLRELNMKGVGPVRRKIRLYCTAKTSIIGAFRKELNAVT